MNRPLPGPHPLSRADRGALWFLIILGGAFALITLTFSTLRIVEILTGDSVSVSADLSHEGSQVLLAGVAPAGYTIDRVTFTVTDLKGATLTAAIAQPILVILITLGVSISFAILARNLLKGRVFASGNTAAVAIAWIVGIIGTLVQPFLNFTVAYGALGKLGYDATPMLALTFSPGLIIAGFLMVAITVHAFGVGTKIQRETEGLV